MMLRMQLLQPFPRHMGIDLRGRDIRMAQQHLHHAQVGAVVEQVRGEGVAQRVRRQRLIQPAMFGVLLIRYQNTWRVMPSPRAVTNSASLTACPAARGGLPRDSA